MTDGKVHLYDGKVLNENGVVALCDGDCCVCAIAYSDCIDVDDHTAVDIEVTIPNLVDDHCDECDQVGGTYVLAWNETRGAWAYQRGSTCNCDYTLYNPVDFIIRFALYCNGDDCAAVLYVSFQARYENIPHQTFKWWDTDAGFNQTSWTLSFVHTASYGCTTNRPCQPETSLPDVSVAVA